MKGVSELGAMCNVGIDFKLMKVLYIFATFLVAIDAQINWDSDIVASPSELQQAKNDALSRYFGSQIDNSTLFRTRDVMKDLIGDFEDVPRDR